MFFKADRFPILWDLPVAYVASEDSYNVHNLAQVSWVRSVLLLICTTSPTLHNRRQGTRIPA